MPKYGPYEADAYHLAVRSNLRYLSIHGFPKELFDYTLLYLHDAFDDIDVGARPYHLLANHDVP